MILESIFIKKTLLEYFNFIKSTPLPFLYNIKGIKSSSPTYTHGVRLSHVQQYSFNNNKNNNIFYLNTVAFKANIAYGAV